MRTEYVSVRIVATEKGQMEVLVGNSLSVILQVQHDYDKAIQRYKHDGYTIKNENPEKLSFDAEKTFEG